MCFPPGRSGPQTSDVSVGTLCTLLLDVFQRLVAAESSMIRGGRNSQAHRHDRASAQVVTRDSPQCQLMAYLRC